MRRGHESGDHDQPPVVAVVNTNPDLVRMLQVALERIGFVVFILHIEDIRLGSTSVDDVLNEHDPKVIVYDVAPPYEQNWRMLEHLRSSTSFRGRQFVLTSVNTRLLEKVVGIDETVYEIAGQPSDIDAVARATKEASRARMIR